MLVTYLSVERGPSAPVLMEKQSVLGGGVGACLRLRWKLVATYVHMSHTYHVEVKYLRAWVWGVRLLRVCALRTPVISVLYLFLATVLA